MALNVQPDSAQLQNNLKMYEARENKKEIVA
jgi:hypothetical protein